MYLHGVLDSVSPGANSVCKSVFFIIPWFFFFVAFLFGWVFFHFFFPRSSHACKSIFHLFIIEQQEQWILLQSLASSLVALGLSSKQWLELQSGAERMLCA